MEKMKEVHMLMGYGDFDMAYVKSVWSTPEKAQDALGKTKLKDECFIEKMKVDEDVS